VLPPPPGIEAGKARTRGTPCLLSLCTVRGIGRVPEARNEASRIFYGDVPIGTIGSARRAGRRRSTGHRNGPGVRAPNGKRY
jgi:hypothetical protein